MTITEKVFAAFDDGSVERFTPVNKEPKTEDKPDQVMEEDKPARSWWNNGEEQILAVECPGEDWVKGKIKKG